MTTTAPGCRGRQPAHAVFAIVVLTLVVSAPAALRTQVPDTSSLQTQAQGVQPTQTQAQGGQPTQGEQPTLPSGPGAVRFGVIGDSGTGDKRQYEVAAKLAEYHRRYPFDFVIMLGDNMYGSQRPEDFVRKFERPYAPLIEAGVKFYAALGNHDNPPEIYYKPFSMDGRRYYTFSKGPVQFFVLDSNYMDPKQLAWIEQELKGSDKRWKICYFHHPLYSSGAKHGSEVDLRELVEPLFVRHGVDVVFAGHEHFYERVKPQKGIAYFTVGGSAKLRKGDITDIGLTEKGFDTDRSFMVAAIEEGSLHFQVISRIGSLVDSGIVPDREAPSRANDGTAR